MSAHKVAIEVDFTDSVLWEPEDFDELETELARWLASYLGNGSVERCEVEERAS